MSDTPPAIRVVVHVYGWRPGEHLEVFESESLPRAQGFARRATRRDMGAAFATLHVEDDPRVHLYARGRLSRRLTPQAKHPRQPPSR